MKHLFLTSSPFTGAEQPFTAKNRFAERLLAAGRSCRRGLMITASPSDFGLTEAHSYAIRRTLELTGIIFQDYTILDDRNKAHAVELVRSCDFIILGGGHCPTQNAFFREIGLRDLMKGFDGPVFGISAGSMNCADLVYAQPEAEGESEDPAYEKFIPGLGLTKCMLLPHYQENKDRILDRKRLFEEITYPDSCGRQFIAICDGSYLYSDGTDERICGEAWLIRDGKIRKICGEEEEYGYPDHFRLSGSGEDHFY